MSREKPFFGRFFRAVRAVFRPFFRIDERPQAHPSPCVYICRHKNMEGPLYVALNFLDRFHIWALSVFVDRAECFSHYYGYTFTERYGWPRPIAYVVARLGSLVVPGFNRAMRAIPVYRSSTQIIKTYRQSVSALLKGERLMIFPDVDYKSEEDGGVVFYEGFLLLDKYYQAKIGEPLDFVPLYVDAKKRRIVKGKPVCFEKGERNHIAASKDVAQRLIGAIEELKDMA